MRWRGGSNGKPVVKIDYDGNTIERYKSIKEAADKNFVTSSVIYHRCHDMIENPYEFIGYTFKFEDDINEQVNR